MGTQDRSLSGRGAHTLKKDQKKKGWTMRKRKGVVSPKETRWCGEKAYTPPRKKRSKSNAIEKAETKGWRISSGVQGVLIARPNGRCQKKPYCRGTYRRRKTVNGSKTRRH